MKEIPSSGHPLIDGFLWIWFALTALAVAYVGYDQFKGEREQRESSLAMKTMRWGWVLVTLYTGPFGVIVYWFLHSTPARKTPRSSLWEESVESTIHCVAGDATGILIAAAVGNWLRLPMGVELIAEYVAGFVVGLLLFQALCMKSAYDGSYWRAVWGTFLPETLSMNTVMAGMIPVMIILMSRDMRAMEPTSVRFWGTMSLSFVVSAVITLPVNWWLVARGLKHGMGGEERARHRHPVSVASKLKAMVLTLAMLAGGITLAARYGDFSLRAGDSMDTKPKPLRIITDKAATIHWSFDGWATANDLESRDTGFGCWLGDLPADRLPAGARIRFEFLWEEGWKGKDFQVEVAASDQIQKPYEHI
jgi:hypothetical protein